jgi:uncharacterized protein YlzI (FlbEa/FlbD family)
LIRQVFETLRAQEPEVTRLLIVGRKKDVPSRLLRDPLVEVVETGVSDEVLYAMLRNAAYYISASEIENSSVATLEALLLADNIVLSDIPSHREAITDLPNVVLELQSGVRFLVVDAVANRRKVRSLSWDEVASKMLDVASDALTGK